MRNALKKIIILGAGDHAREQYFHIQDIWGDDFEAIFVDDFIDKTSHFLKGREIQIVKNWKFPNDFKQFVVGLSEPRAKKIMCEKALQAGLLPAPTLIHPRATVQDAKLGMGGLIGPGAVLTTNIELGNYVVINYNVTIGHDSLIENFVTINPGANIAGRTRLKEGVEFGSGAITKQKISIASWCKIGAQAAVVKSIEEESTVWAGVPARLLKRI